LQTYFESVLWVDVGDKAASLLVPEMISKCGQRPPDTYAAQAQTLQAIFLAHRYLVVLDDVRANAQSQLEDYLPPAPPCAVLVTSRIEQPSRLIPLKNTFELDRMTETQARALLAATLGEETVAKEEATFVAIARRCRWNALALEVAARRIRQMSGWTTPAQRYLDKLEAHGLSEMRIEGDARWDMAAVFDASYNDLLPEDQKRFRALAAFHPTGFNPLAAARIWQAEVAEAEAALRRLQNLSLVKIVPGAAERYRLHDLLDEYAADKLRRADEAKATQTAMAGWLIELFNDHYAEDVTTAPEVDLEINNLLRAITEAEMQKDGRQMAELLSAGRNWLMLTAFDQWEQKAHAANSIGISNPRLQANVLKAIGDVQQFRDDRDAALKSYEQALGLFRQVGAKLGEANVLQSKGKLFVVTGKGDEGLKLLQESLSLYEAIGDMTSGVNIYFFLAQVMASSGHHKEAIPLAEKVIAIIERVDSSHPALQTARDFLQQLQQQANAG
jgi:tetratricopeptide (TPR) repeat protein